MKCFGIAGWKNSGKTTLVASLVKEITSRGIIVSTLKHAHHSFDLDQKGTDSFKHREAGARETVLVSRNRWAIQHELDGEDEPSFLQMLERISPCDLLLVEGYKREAIPKIEIIGPEPAGQEMLWETDKNVLALATEVSVKDCALPVFSRDNVREIADFILEHHRISF